jgi:hypothetical protein
MIKNYYQKYIKIIIAISVLLTVGFVILFPPNKFDRAYVWNVVSKITTIDIVLIYLFTKYLWKRKLFQGWLVPFPNLTGRWDGTIKSTWVDPTSGKNPAPIPASLSIKQNFFHINCVMYTAETKSRSMYGYFEIDEETQVKRLVYSYQSNPKSTIAYRSPRQYGTVIFEISTNNGIPYKLIGNYWTDVKTTGEIILSYRDQNIIDEYPQELGHHPMHE